MQNNAESYWPKETQECRIAGLQDRDSEGLMQIKDMGILCKMSVGRLTCTASAKAVRRSRG